MAKKNRTKYAILGLLSYHPMSGYDIQKVTDKSLNFFWSENYSQIYPNLKALEKEGLATVTVEENDGKPNRKVYTITPAGLEVLRTWLQVGPEPEVRRIELLLKLFFGRQLSPEILQGFVMEYQEDHKNILEELQEIEASLLSISDRNIDQEYQLMSVRYGIAVESALELWCNQSLETFKELIQKYS